MLREKSRRKESSYQHKKFDTILSMVEAESSERIDWKPITVPEGTKQYSGPFGAEDSEGRPMYQELHPTTREFFGKYDGANVKVAHSGITSVYVKVVELKGEDMQEANRPVIPSKENEGMYITLDKDNHVILTEEARKKREEAGEKRRKSSKPVQVTHTQSVLSIPGLED